MTNIIWLEIDPVDTLFFRGAESMEAGENHEVDTLFPPMPSTIIGAIRTAILKQQGIHPVDYLKQPDTWQKRHPFLGTPAKPGFDLVGPILLKDNELLFPAPASWYADITHNPPINNTQYTVQAAEPLSKPPLGLCGSVSKPFWIKNPISSDMQPLAGMWVTSSAFTSISKGQNKLRYREDPTEIPVGEAAMLPGKALFSREERVGIALTRQRTAKDGHLYSTVHIQLRNGIKLAVGITSNNESCLAPRGILQLGGEQRICRYQTRSDLKTPQIEHSKLLCTISPINLSTLPKELQNCPRASNKLVRVGGWDMQKNFHKPMEAYLPAGTVIASDDAAQKTNHFLTI